jgi:hypothetical protein
MSALREEAEREALERRVDRTVRIVALGGDPGWAHVNYSREVALDEETTLRVEATFGARVNGATVRHSAHGIVYEALDYGRCLVVYRAGRWLEALERLASELGTRRNTEDAVRPAQAPAEEDERFSPLD